MRGLDMEISEPPSREKLAEILALMLTAPDDERALGAFDLAWKIADLLQQQGDAEFFVERADWDWVRGEAVRLAGEWRDKSGRPDPDDDPEHAAVDYDAVCAWAQERLDEWHASRQELPRVRHHHAEIVGTLSFTPATRDLSLNYERAGGKRAHRRIFADDVAKGYVQVKVGARYRDIREVIRNA